MDELRGDQGIWQFDGESVQILYHGKRSQNPLLRRLGKCRVPLVAVARAECDPPVSGKRWTVRLVLHEGVDPYAAAGATLTKHARPFLLTGKASPLVAEYWADQVSFAARRALEQAPAPPEPGLLARQVVPSLPVQIKSTEGTAGFDGSTVRLTWSGSAASVKRKAGSREFPLAQIRRVEWIPTDGWQWDLLRVVTADGSEGPASDPKRDLSCLRCYPGTEGADGLLLAATVTAYLDPADVAGDRVAELERMLLRLHAEGLLTDAELATKRTQLRS